MFARPFFTPCNGPWCQNEVLGGTGDERALRKLTHSVSVLCTRHLKQNTDVFLQNKVELNQADRADILDAFLELNVP